MMETKDPALKQELPEATEALEDRPFLDEAPEAPRMAPVEEAEVAPAAAVDTAKVYQAQVPYTRWPAPYEMQAAAALPPRRFRLSTMLRPLGYMFLHLFVMMGAMVALLTAIMLANGEALDLEQVPQLLERLVMRSDVQIQATLIMGLLLIPIYLMVLRGLKRRDPRAMMLEPFTLKGLLTSLLLIVGALGATVVLMSVFELFKDSSPFIARHLARYQELVHGLLQVENDWWLNLLATVVLVPVAEELLFRGIIMGELRRAFSDTTALLLSSVLFALFHMNVIQSSYVFLPGLILGLGYLMTRNLWVPILMHALFNFLGGMLPLLLAGQERWLMLSVILELVAMGLAALYLVSKKAAKQPLYLPEA